MERQRRQDADARQLQALDDEIDHERRLAKYKVEEEEQRRTLKQRQADLESIKETQKRMKEQEKKRQLLAAQVAARASDRRAQQPADMRSPDSTPDFEYPENAKEEWEHLKQFDGAQSTPMDELMTMIGLEDVKQMFLSIKSKVDLTLRQSTSLASERFSCSMLGNPGTGWSPLLR